MEDGRITNDQITASSRYSTDLAPYYGRLNRLPDSVSSGGWVAGRNDQNQWLRVDFRTKVKIYHIGTQGLSHKAQFVKTYKLQYSDDGKTFTDYGQILSGNLNNKDIALTTLNPSVEARVVKIIPVTWQWCIAMRVEFYGCESDLA